VNILPLVYEFVVFRKQSLDLVQMMQWEEEMLASMKAANEEVSILVPLNQIFGIGFIRDHLDVYLDECLQVV